MPEYDAQSDAQTSRAMVQKAIDDGAFRAARHGLFRLPPSSTCCRAAGRHPAVHRLRERPRSPPMGNPYIFRTSLGSQKSIPKVAQYMQDEIGREEGRLVWGNTEFGKAGYDAFTPEMEARGIEIAADIPTENAQADFAADVVKARAPTPTPSSST